MAPRNNPFFGPNKDNRGSNDRSRDRDYDRNDHEEGDSDRRANEHGPRLSSNYGWTGTANLERNHPGENRNFEDRGFDPHRGRASNYETTGDSRFAGTQSMGPRSSYPYSNEGSHFGKGPKNYRRSDERLQDEVNECLWRHSEIDATDIEIRVKDGVVTLSGSVTERQTRRDAEMAIESIPGVLDVKNELTVSRPGIPTSTSNPSSSTKSKPIAGSKNTTDMM